MEQDPIAHVRAAIVAITEDAIRRTNDPVEWEVGKQAEARVLGRRNSDDTKRLDEILEDTEKLKKLVWVYAVNPSLYRLIGYINELVIQNLGLKKRVDDITLLYLKAEMLGPYRRSLRWPW